MTTTPKLALIPSAYKASKLYSVLPTDGTGDFTVSRGTGATGLRHRINKDLKLEIIDANVPALNYDTIGGCPVLNTEPQVDNLITYPISFGNSYWTKSGATIEGDPSTAGAELVTNGDFTTDTDWTKGTGWSIGSGVASCDGTQTGDTNLYQPFAWVNNQDYIIKLDITVTAGDLLIWGGQSSAIKTITTSGSHIIHYNSNLSGNPTTLYIQGNVNFIGTIDNVSIKEVQGYSAPSVDFPTSAFKLVVSNTTSVAKYLNSSVITVGGGTATIVTTQFFVKKSDVTKVGISDGHYNYGWVAVDLTDMSVISTGGAGYISNSIKAFADDWYLISLTFTTHSTGTYKATCSLLDDSYVSGNPKLYAHVGVVGQGVYLFMAQAEQGSYATSPTFTDTTLASEGRTTMRLADAVTGAGDVNTFNDSEGVLFINTSSKNSTTSKQISISDGSSASNKISLTYTTTTNQIQAFVRSGGSIVFNETYVLSDSSDFNKIALKYKANDFALWVNGVEVATDNVGVTPTGLDVLDLHDADGSSNFNGNTKQIQYYNTALSDAELQALTTL